MLSTAVYIVYIAAVIVWSRVYKLESGIACACGCSVELILDRLRIERELAGRELVMQPFHLTVDTWSIYIMSHIISKQKLRYPGHQMSWMID